MGDRSTLSTSRSDISIDVARDSQLANKYESLSDHQLVFDFRTPGNRAIGISVHKSDGRISRSEISIQIHSALGETVKERYHIPPSEVTTLELPLRNTEEWISPRAISSNLSCTVEPAPTGLTLSINAPDVLGNHIVDLVAQRRADGGECTIARLEIEVAYNESIDFARSRLDLSGRGIVLFHSEGSMPNDRVDALLSTFGKYKGEHQLSGRQKELTVHLLASESGDEPIWVDLPRAGLRLFNPSAFELALSQTGREEPTDYLPSRPIRIALNDAQLKPFEEGGEGGVAVICRSPLVEWVQVERVSPGILEVTPKSPGSYSVILVHHTQAVYRRDFDVGSEDFRIPAPSLQAAEVSEEVGDELVGPRVAQFVSKFQRAPMMIAIGPSGSSRIADTLKLAAELTTHLGKLSDRDVLIFVVPGNDVPASVSSALFSSGLKWVALSYPAPRNFKPVSFEKAVKQFTGFLGRERQRVEWHRFVPQLESGEWSPAMHLRCPTCSRPLTVDVRENPPLSRCKGCGFSSSDVEYSMDDLDKHSNHVFVIQHDMLGYLHRKSEEWFGKRLLRIIHCRRCEFVAPFRDRESIESWNTRFLRVVPGRMSGDMEQLIEGGWWVRDGASFSMTELTQKIRHGHCPKCCYWHRDDGPCQDSPLEDGISSLQIILAGLDRFTVSEDDPYELVKERFPEFHYHELSGDQDPRTKVEAMIRGAAAWWRME